MIALTCDQRVWRLSGELSRKTAAALRESLASAGQFPEDGELDLAEVTQLDAAGVQLLASFRRTFASARLTNANERIRAVCQQLGATQYLFGNP